MNGSFRFIMSRMIVDTQNFLFRRYSLHASIIISVKDFSDSTEYNFMRFIRVFGKRREVLATLSSVVNNIIIKCNMYKRYTSIQRYRNT